MIFLRNDRLQQRFR